MAIFVDARIPVTFEAARPGSGDALLIEGDSAGPDGVPTVRFPAGRAGHPIGCACCTPRGPVAKALHVLLLARARGECPAFVRVLVMASASGEAAVRQALAEDVFVAGRYRAAK
jgi:hypothetical protein